MYASQLTLVAVLLLEVATSTHLYERPNIVVILADDLGWNDVSFHGSSQIPTPNIDALAYNGIILNSHYVPALCTPSRSSLLTGKYPTSTGMQHLVILEPEPWGLPLSERLMPEYLQAAGYSTHAIGKWHLGFFKKEYTPLFRGFDSHYGYYNGFQDYYDHTVKATFAPYKGYDMRRNMSVDWDAKGSYSTDLFTNEAVRTINNHNVHQGPLFMYLAHLAPHTGNQEDPFQAPDEEIAKFGYIEDPERRVYAAMVSKVDQSVGEVVSALRVKGMLDNTIILFMSDNGAPTHGIHSNRGSNWPLRGMKHTAMEGGLRGVAAIWSPLLNNTQRVSNQLMHISDWLPTFYSAAGLNVADLGEIDGVDMWRALSDNLPSPRTEILHNIDEIEEYAAMRSGDWKYITGTAQGGRADKWYGESGLEDTSPTYDTTAVLRSKAGSAIIGLVTKLQLREKEERFAKIKENESGKSDSPKKHATYRRLLSKSMILSIRQQAQVSCSSKLGLNPKDPMAINMTANESSRKLEMDSNNTDCNPAVSPCLFNIHNDPCETVNLASLHPRVVKSLEARLEGLRTTMVKPRNTPGDPNANPVFWNDTWISWLDDIKEEILTTEVHNTSLPPRPTLAPNPVTILTVIASLFGVIALILMAVILKMYLVNIPDAWSLFSVFLTKDNKPEELSKQKNVE